MTVHLLVDQLRFARSELIRCLEGVSDADARRRIEPMNCISWIIGHLADQEHRWWVMMAQGKMVVPGLNERVGYGRPPSAPPLEEMWAAWQAVTAEADRYLDTLTPELLETHLEWKGKPRAESIGTMLLRNIYHYWFHTGEAYAIRQLLGHVGLPEFVGDMSAAAYRREAAEMLPVPADKPDLMARVAREWSALMEAVAGLTVAQLTRPGAGGWSAKDNLAHLAAWERLLLLYHLGGRPAHEVLGLDRMTFEGLDETGINALIFKRNHDRPLADVLAELRDTHAQVLAAVEGLAWSALMKPRYPADPEARPVLDWVIGNTYEHYREHRGNIEALIGE